MVFTERLENKKVASVYRHNNFSHSQELSGPKTAYVQKVFLNEVINHVLIFMFGHYQKINK